MAKQIFDKDFLYKLDHQRNQTTYAKITSLTKEGHPQDSLEGYITQGSLNIDGTGAVRRNCSLTLAVKDYKQNNFYWALKTRFRLEIGVLNTVDNNYPNIIWFNYGIFIIDSFSASQTVSNAYNISITGKDKMFLLNGTYGGIIPAETDFSQEEIVSENGNIEIKKLLVKDIITNLVQVYANEPSYNIVIKDLPEYGYELWSYRGKSLIKNNENKSKETYLYYLYRVQENSTSDLPDNVTFNGDMKTTDGIMLKEIPLEDLYIKGGNQEGTIYTINNHDYKISRVGYGETAGFHRTDLIYPADLIAAAGDNVSNVLTKICNMLGEYEYFFDEYGRFVFQEKRSFVQNRYSLNNNEYFMNNSYYEYEFNNLELISQCSLQPRIENIKNDFIVIAQKEDVNGGKIPIRARIAIDKKPTEYTTMDYYKRIYFTYLYVVEGEWDNKKNNYTFDGTKYKYETSRVEGTTLYFHIVESLVPLGTDTPIIYQKVDKDYVYVDTDMMQVYKRNQYKEFEPIEDLELIFGSNLSNTEFFELSDSDKSVTKTAQEVDWRELIWLMARDYYQHNQEASYADRPKTGYEQYYQDIFAFWRKLYDLNNKDYVNGWNPNWYTNPENLEFYFDFIEPLENSEIMKYSVLEIGQRPIVDKGDQVKVIKNRDNHEVEFYKVGEQIKDTNEMALTKIQIPTHVEELFGLSTQGISALDKIYELINKHLLRNDNINLTTIPIYHLDVNTRIHINNSDLEIDGDYQIQSLQLSLGTNGNTTINTVKIIPLLI